MWMNEHEAEDAARRNQAHPVLGPATRTLTNLIGYTNSHSDGWPYYRKPANAAARLMDLIEQHAAWERSEYRLPREGQEATAAAYRAALTPLKAFATRSGWDFEIEYPGQRTPQIDAIEQHASDLAEAALLTGAAARQIRAKATGLRHADKLEQIRVLAATARAALASAEADLAAIDGLLAPAEVTP